jgi:hypothetical protein
MQERDPPVWRRIAWFVSLWAGGVIALALVAGLVRMWLG